MDHIDRLIQHVVKDVVLDESELRRAEVDARGTIAKEVEMSDEEFLAKLERFAAKHGGVIPLAKKEEPVQTEPVKQIPLTEVEVVKPEVKEPDAVFYALEAAFKAGQLSRAQFLST